MLFTALASHMTDAAEGRRRGAALAPERGYGRSGARRFAGAHALAVQMEPAGALVRLAPL